jgi:hypothetical protein
MAKLNLVNAMRINVRHNALVVVRGCIGVRMALLTPASLSHGQPRQAMPEPKQPTTWRDESGFADSATNGAGRSYAALPGCSPCCRVPSSGIPATTARSTPMVGFLETPLRLKRIVVASCSHGHRPYAAGESALSNLAG